MNAPGSLARISRGGEPGRAWLRARAPAVSARTMVAVPPRQVRAIGLPPGGEPFDLQLQTRKSAQKTGVTVKPPSEVRPNRLACRLRPALRSANPREYEPCHYPEHGGSPGYGAAPSLGIR